MGTFMRNGLTGHPASAGRKVDLTSPQEKFPAVEWPEDGQPPELLGGDDWDDDEDDSFEDDDEDEYFEDDDEEEFEDDDEEEDEDFDDEDD